jgi:hypothetical protein
LLPIPKESFKSISHFPSPSLEAKDNREREKERKRERKRERKKDRKKGDKKEKQKGKKTKRLTTPGFQSWILELLCLQINGSLSVAWCSPPPLKR